MNTISGMNSQAEAFAHFLNICVELEYDGIIDKKPYFNCRERGFVISVWGKKSRQAKHFAWFEHRNSDQLCCLAWEGEVTGENGDFFTWKDVPAKIYPDKWTVTKSFPWGAFGDAGSWLREEVDAYVAKQMAAA